MYRLFEDAQQYVAGTPSHLEQWRPRSTDEHYLAMTQEQQQAVSQVPRRCQCHKGAVVRGMHLRREKENRRLQTQDSAIAASFYGDEVQLAVDNELVTFPAALKASYGIVQEIISVPVAFSLPQVFLNIKWYKQSLVAEDSRIRGVPLIKCSGTAADFEEQDVDVSKETLLMRAERIDQQIFFVDCPGWSTTPANQPWRWVCREVTSSLALAEHQLDDEGRIIPRDEDA